MSGKEAFFGLLDCYIRGPHVPWERAMLDIMSDPRYGSLRTMDEKKRAYAEWCERGRRAEDATARAERKKLRDDFARLVAEKLEAADSGGRTTYADLRPLLTRDPRFAALDDDNERAEVFSECLRRREREQQAAARVARKEEIGRFKEMLQKDTHLTPQTQWRKVCDKYLSAFEFKELRPADAAGYFDAYMRSLDREKQLEERLRKEENERRCRFSRDAFRDLLTEQVTRETITLDTKWKAFKPTIRDEPRYKALKSRSYSGLGPEELFDEAVGILRARYEADEEIMTKALDGHTITSATTADEVKALLKGVDVPERSLDVFSKSLVRRAAEKEAKERKRLEERFLDALAERRKRSELISKGMTFDEAEREGISHFDGLDEETRRKLFEDYLSYLEDSESSQSSSPSSSSSSSSSSLSPPSKKKTKSHHHHHHYHHHRH